MIFVFKREGVDYLSHGFVKAEKLAYKDKRFFEMRL